MKKLVRKAAPVLIFSEHMDAADGERMFRHASVLGLEGIVSKRLDKPYSSGRCQHWRKVKNPAYERRSGVNVSVRTWRSGIGNRGRLLVREVL